VQSFEGDEAVDLLQMKVMERASDRNRPLMNEFADWLREQDDADDIVPVLHAWYQMLDVVAFAIDDPEPADINDLLDRADPGDTDSWKWALNVFYSKFLTEEREQDIDLPAAFDQ